MPVYFLVVSKKMGFAHLHPKACICDKFREWVKNLGSTCSQCMIFNGPTDRPSLFVLFLMQGGSISRQDESTCITICIYSPMRTQVNIVLYGHTFRRKAKMTLIAFRINSSKKCFVNMVADSRSIPLFQKFS